MTGDSSRDLGQDLSRGLAGPDLAGPDLPGPDRTGPDRAGAGGTNGAIPAGPDAATTVLDDPRPRPTTTRWQPLRIGLLNLYRFDDEEFRFAGGRLLLRGNNGTGKSRVLALTLPFLLDGEASPHRLEPDGDSAKRIEWNLLMGRHDDRLGYSWIEFGRLDDGSPRFTTLGIGMRAVKGRGLAQKWLFVTDRRISTTSQPAGDDDLVLVADAGQALTRDRLRTALDGRGQVFDTAEAYRAEVDRRLFGLGTHRYAALVDLLIQLRRPQLSRQMDSDALSDALSEALPPLPRAVIGDVAEAFRTLEADRDQLSSFTAAADATATFLDTYRHYAAVAVRRRAAAVTSTNSDYEGTQRRLRTAEVDRADAEAELERLTAERDTARDDEHTATAQVRTLETSPAMDRVRELHHARTAASEAAERRADAEEERDRAAKVVDDRQGRMAAASSRTAVSQEGVVAAVDHAGDLAASAYLADDHVRALEALDLPDADVYALGPARAAAENARDRRREALDHLATLDGALDRAARGAEAMRARRDHLAEQLDHARDDERAAADGRDHATAAVLDAYRDWVDDLAELAPAAPDELAWELETWRDTAADRSPLARTVDHAVGTATAHLADLRATNDRDRDQVAQQRRDVADERDRIAAAPHLEPPVPHTRDPRARDGRPGAPLWQLVEPVDGLAASDVAGYEAALESAGLLDAWVTPGARVLSAADLDVAVVTADVAPAPDGGLGHVFTPAVDRTDPQAAAIDDDTVRAVLARVGRDVDAGTVWVSPDGRHRVGPRRGAWAKPVAQHLGHAAREQARRARLADLDRDLGDLDDHLAELDTRRAVLDDRTGRLAVERDNAPTDVPIRDAAAIHHAAVRHAGEQRQRNADAEAAVVRATADLDQARAARHEAAVDLGLGSVEVDLAGLERALADYTAALATLWPTVTAHAAALADQRRAGTDLDEATTVHQRQAERARSAREVARDLATRRDTLDATVGEEADQVLARLERARTALVEATARREQLDEDRVTTSGRREAAQQQVDDLGETLDEHARRRGEAITRLAAAVDAGLAPVARRDLAAVVDEAPDADWSADRGVRLARRIDQTLDDVDVDDGAWSRVAQAIHGHYTDLEHALLPHDLHPTASLADDLFVVTAPFQGEARTVPALHDLLVDEVTNRRALLTAREREILHNHLIGDVAAHLHRLLRAGEDWVAEVNAELDAMPTSTGMKLRFAWQPRTDLPTFPAARRHLLGHHAGWSPDQRDEIGAFLQERITQVREADPTGTWQHHLETALDHRGWHRFVVERHQDGQWTRLTRRSHGTGSGGEKALALTVPQFAAAAAHYRSADDHAPRLIMLDEAFVGIDAGMRANCLGLLDQFDLDLVMTSEREWGCYPTVPALAIAQLATRPGIDAIGVSRWVWNGRTRVRDQR